MQPELGSCDQPAQETLNPKLQVERCEATVSNLFGQPAAAAVQVEGAQRTLALPCWLLIWQAEVLCKM